MASKDYKYLSGEISDMFNELISAEKEISELKETIENLESKNASLQDEIETLIQTKGE
jgi:predicted  nucleic acid-binding Zn-ribbon protein